jgi:two-component system, OmpR family, sensor histidine kinase VicK
MGASMWLKKKSSSASSGDLEAEKAKSSIILNAIEDGVVAIDHDKVIRVFNPAAAKLTGWEANDAIGLDYQSVLQFTDDKGEIIKAELDPIAQAISTKAPVRDNNINLVSKDKKQYMITIGVSPITGSGDEPNGLVAIFRDISQEKSEEKRRADFISTASHEMRTPVAAIEGYLALALNDKVSQIDAKARGYLEKAHSSTQHLGKLFQDLLTSAKAEDGRLVNHPVVVEMGAFLEQLTDSLRFSAEKKGLLMEFIVGVSQNPAEGKPTGGKVLKPLYYVLVDPDRMQEVITNLFDNAVKYTESGKVSIGLTGNDSVVQIYIKDTGPGIAAEDLPHLFQKFYRVDNSVTRTIGGTGLGLFICRKIVELYNGRIWVESAVGQGSTFYMNLPRISTQKATEMQSAQATKASSLT